MMCTRKTITPKTSTCVREKQSHAQSHARCVRACAKKGARTHTTTRTCTPVLDCSRNASLCLSFALYACFLAQLHDVPLLVPNVKKIAHPHPVNHFAGDSTCCLKSSETSNNFIVLGLQLVFERHRFAAR